VAVEGGDSTVEDSGGADGSGWQRMAADGSGWQRMAADGSGWHRMASDGSGRIKLKVWGVVKNPFFVRDLPVASFFARGFARDSRQNKSLTE
jgi:hypothetical protein